MHYGKYHLAAWVDLMLFDHYVKAENQGGEAVTSTGVQFIYAIYLFIIGMFELETLGK